MNLKILFCIFIPVLLLNSCISEFNPELKANEKQVLFVDGYITENSDAIFSLSKSIPMNSPGFPEESTNINAKLTLISSNGYIGEPAIYRDKGTYMLHIGELKDDVEYGLRIEYEGDIYQSTLSKPIHTPEIDSISWVQPKEGGSISFCISTHDDFDNARFFLWSFTEDWETVAKSETSLFFDPRTQRYSIIEPAPYYFCWRSSNSNSFLVGSTESLNENRIINKQIYHSDFQGERFIVLYSITVHQKAISKDAYEYYQNTIKVNEEMGGLFTPQPAEFFGNISCITDPSKKVMGYVGVSKNTTQKRLFVYPNEIKHPVYYDFCTTISTDSLRTLMYEIGGTFVDAYNMGYRPTGNTLNIMTGLPYEWTIVTCSDCVANGGTKNKPDFWPNDHE